MGKILSDVSQRIFVVKGEDEVKRLEELNKNEKNAKLYKRHMGDDMYEVTIERIAYDSSKKVNVDMSLKCDTSEINEATKKITLLHDRIVDARLNLNMLIKDINCNLDRTTSAVELWEKKLYVCDPNKNIKCDKGPVCCINGGPCHETSNINYSVNTNLSDE